MNEDLAIRYTIRHYNFHPEEKFNSVEQVVMCAKKSMEPDSFQVFTSDLRSKLMEHFNYKLLV